MRAAGNLHAGVCRVRGDRDAKVLTVLALGKLLDRFGGRPNLVQDTQRGLAELQNVHVDRDATVHRLRPDQKLPKG